MLISAIEKIKVKTPRRPYTKRASKGSWSQVKCYNCEESIRVRTDDRQLNRYCNRTCFGLGSRKIYKMAREEGVYLGKGSVADKKKGVGTYLTLQCDKEGCEKTFIRKENYYTPNGSYCSRNCYFMRDNKPDWNKNPLVKKVVEAADIPTNKKQEVVSPAMEIVHKLSDEIRAKAAEEAEKRCPQIYKDITRAPEIKGDDILAREVQIAKDIAQVETWKNMGMTDEDIMVMRAAMRIELPKGIYRFGPVDQNDTFTTSFQTLFKNMQNIMDRVKKLDDGIYNHLESYTKDIKHLDQIDDILLGHFKDAKKGIILSAFAIILLSVSVIILYIRTCGS